MAPQDREEEQEQGFVVSDKRLFTSEGERRAGSDRPEPESTSPPRQEGPPERHPDPPPGPEPSPEMSEAPPMGEPPAAQETRSADTVPEIDFATYVVMLANSVMMLLGQVPDPATQQRHLDLPQAKHTIDILLMLREKTQGNLTSEEAQLLEDVMPQLQMAYVSVSQQVG